MSHVLHVAVPVFICAVIVLMIAWRSQALAFAAVLLMLVGANSSFDQIKHWSLDGRWGGLAALALSAVWTLPLRWPARPPRLLSLALWTLVGLCFVSAAWSVDPRLTVERAASFAVLLWGIFAVVRPAIVDEAEMRRLVAGIAAVAGVVALVSLVDWALRPEHAVITSQLRGVFENPNGLGLMLGMCLPILLAWAERRTGRAYLPVVAVLLIGVLALEFLSQARAGLAALLLGSIGYEIARGRLRQTLLPIGAVLAVGLMFQFWHPLLAQPPSTVSPTGLLETAAQHHAQSSRLQRQKQRSTLPTSTGLLGGVGIQGEPRLDRLLGARNEAWSQTVDLVSQRPVVGYGFGTGDRLLDTRKWVYFDGSSPHNAYLQSLLELGAVGALLLVLPLLLGLRRAAELILSRQASPEQAAFAALLVAGLFNAVFEDILTSAGAPFDPLIWLAAAAMLVHVREIAPAAGRVRAARSTVIASG